MKKTQFNSTTIFTLILIAILCTPINFASAFAYIFTNNGVDVVAHPTGYNGTGGTVTVTVGIAPGSPFAADMVIPTQNAVAMFNGLVSTTGNVAFGNIPSGNVDYESVLLHEMGHSLGLAHCNAATESGEIGANQNYTKALAGPNLVLDLSPGPDGIIGSADDVRGDDINLNYFKITDNNPFTIPATIDQTTYSREISNLPPGDVFSTNGDRDVSVTLGVPNTESAMQQGSFSNEDQRTLAADDVAGLRYAMAGIDETAGTADDYVLVLDYIGIDATADILIAFDNSETGFAVSQSGGVFIGGDHISITSNNIFFNTGFNWFFNPSLSIEDTNLSSSDISLFPNPAENSVSIRNPFLLDLKNISIYDINGRLIKNSDFNVDNNLYEMEINISEFKSGIYLFVIKSDKGQLVKRIIKN